MVSVARLDRVSGCGPEGRRFEFSHSPHLYASVAQLVERRSEEPSVIGSTPVGSTM